MAGYSAIFTLVFLEVLGLFFEREIGFLRILIIPLTQGTITTVFGVKNMSMLYGIAFLFHQVGAFLGGWLGGKVYDVTGNKIKIKIITARDA